jgi:para-nitrobenzyl esterase
MFSRRKFIEAASVTAAAAAISPFAGAIDVSSPVANTMKGKVSGYRSGRVLAFKGIPYGADTRTTRFQAPRPVGPWTDVRPCTEWPARAPQQSPDRAKPNPVAVGFNAIEDAPVHYHLPPDEGPQTEDCLHVNVWTPSLNNPKILRKRPVLFYIHGGAYNNGTVNAVLYDGTRLAERGDVVVVTVNHRLNAFGYMYLGGIPELSERYRDSGNVGMLDLVLALQWVKENIANFGGDPGNVTIFGQSGGGAKCATLMAMPSAIGLFHKVLTMSGQQVWAAPRRVSTERAKTALAAMGITGEITPAKLDALSMDQIQAGARTTPNWLPVRDDVVLHRDPFDPDAPKQSAGIPMILGNTKDEVMGATAWQRAGLTWETLPEELGKNIAPFKGTYTVEEIIKAYRGWYPGATPVDVFTAAVTAFRSWPGQVIEAERRASDAESVERTWVYQMNFPSPTANGRAPHTEDIAFIFDNLNFAPGMVGDSAQDLAAAQPLATMMSGMLIAFARTGDPNHPGMPHWPVYDLKERRTMLLDRSSKVVSDPRSEERRMMVGARYRQPGT